MGLFLYCDTILFGTQVKLFREIGSVYCQDMISQAKKLKRKGWNWRGMGFEWCRMCVTLKLRTGNHAKRRKVEGDGEGESGMGEATRYEGHST